MQNIKLKILTDVESIMQAVNGTNWDLQEQGYAEHYLDQLGGVAIIFIDGKPAYGWNGVNWFDTKDRMVKLPPDFIPTLSKSPIDEIANDMDES